MEYGQNQYFLLLVKIDKCLNQIINFIQVGFDLFDTKKNNLKFKYKIDKNVQAYILLELFKKRKFSKDVKSGGLKGCHFS